MPRTKRSGPWLTSVPIVVSDKNVAKKWYTEKLGLEVIADDGRHWVTVGNKSKGSGIHLCQASENRPKPIPMEPGPWGYVFTVPGDFLAECQRMKENGVEFTEGPAEAAWGWYAVISDPDQNVLYLSATSPK